MEGPHTKTCSGDLGSSNYTPQSIFTLMPFGMPWARAARGTEQVLENDGSYLWISKSAA